MVTFQNDQHTGALPGRLVRNPTSVGLGAGRKDVQAARGGEDVERADLSDYAVELSQGGGASALARVNRAEEAAKARL